MKGLIFDIKHFALHDGPGIRQTVFFKACPMRCAWCHNPESWKKEIETFTIEKKIGNNTFQTKQQIGKWYSIDELFKIILKDLPFFEQSDGGVSFSGGEPLLQHEFLANISQKCNQYGIHTLVDTCGYTDYEHFKKINPFIDLYYYDIKHVNSTKLKTYTGVDSALIMNNLKDLLEDHKNVIIRIPVIPGFNDQEEDVNEIAETIKKTGINQIHLLPYHKIGESKFRKFNIKQPVEIIDKQIDIEQIKKQYQLTDLNVKIEN